MNRNVYGYLVSVLLIAIGVFNAYPAINRLVSGNYLFWSEFVVAIIGTGCFFFGVYALARIISREGVKQRASKDEESVVAILTITDEIDEVIDRASKIRGVSRREVMAGAWSIGLTALRLYNNETGALVTFSERGRAKHIPLSAFFQPSPESLETYREFLNSIDFDLDDDEDRHKKVLD